MSKIFPLAAASVLLLSVVAWANQAQVVKSRIAKVGVERVIRVELAKEQPKSDKTRVVHILTRAKFPKCAGGTVSYYKDGELDGVAYYSFWAVEQADCPKAHTEDVIFEMELPVGKKQTMVLRGPGRFDQRVSFKVDKERITGMLIKKTIAH